MAELRLRCRRAALQDTTLLLVGEPGTGKIQLARFLHELSPRRGEPLVVFSCAALGECLLESALFGHVRGAFPGADRDHPGMLAAAGNGTLLVDEGDGLPLALENKLLHAAAVRAFRAVGAASPQPFLARLIMTCNTLPDGEGGRPHPRLDGHGNVQSLLLPPLRDRAGIIARLARKFRREFAARGRPEVRGIAADALRALAAYRWPGNIRELRNVLERAVALCRGPEIRLTDLPEAVRCAGAATALSAPDLPVPDVVAPAPGRRP
jgi:two-component system response regulator PilR (NtrC family)